MTVATAERTAAEDLLPEDADFSLHAIAVGPVRAGDFETWPQEEGRPLELIAGWVLPMSPGTLSVGQAVLDLAGVLRPFALERGWTLAFDARHRLPRPRETVLFPDLALHRVAEPELVPGTETVARVPDLVIEVLGEGTWRRDVAPDGAKFHCYRLSGVREYFYLRPGAAELAGYRFGAGSYRELAADDDGCFASEVLGARLRLAPAHLVVG